MRIIQLIDSLEAGGAERMAVNYANVLIDKVTFSGLISTRKEGLLLDQVNERVCYLFLNKKKTIDFKALFRLRDFVIKNKVTVVHAHSTSFFLAFLLKLTFPSIKIIWHNHYGNIENSSFKRLLSLRIIIPFFDGVIAVNQKLKVWSEQKLNSKNVIYLSNFPSYVTEIPFHTILKGVEGKRILSLANLREDKNHFLLLEVAKNIKELHSDWTFHLVGKDFEDDYAGQIKDLIKKLQLENTVFLYDTQQDVGSILKQSTIAVLTSQSEGLPVALLEYGMHKKAVIVTDVGEIPFVIQNGFNGLVVPNHNDVLFLEALVKCINNDKLRETLGTRLFETIAENFSDKVIISQYLNWVQKI